MSAFRVILLIIAVLAQALPAVGMPQTHPHQACAGSCCDPGECLCNESPGSPDVPAPAQLPSVDLRIKAAAFPCGSLALPAPAFIVAQASALPDGRGPLYAPALRLTILFCSMQI